MAEPKPIEKLASALQECLNEAVELGANKALEKIEPRLDRQDAIQDKQNRTLRMFWKQMKGKGPLPIDED